MLENNSNINILNNKEDHDDGKFIKVLSNIIDSLLHNSMAKLENLILTSTSIGEQLKLITEIVVKMENNIDKLNTLVINIPEAIRSSIGDKLTSIISDHSIKTSESFNKLKEETQKSDKINFDEVSEIIKELETSIIESNKDIKTLKQTIDQYNDSIKFSQKVANVLTGMITTILALVGGFLAYFK